MPSKIYINTGSTDITSYVTDMDSIPYLERNDDYSLISSTYNFDLAPTCPSASSINIGDDVLFYHTGSVLLNNGYVTNKKYNYDTLTYTIEVTNVLGKLRGIQTSDFEFNFTNMASRSVSTNIFSGDPYDVITLKGLMDAIFDRIDFSLDWTTHFSDENYGEVIVYDLDGNDTGKFITSSVETQLHFLPDQLPCMNQQGIFTRPYVNDDIDKQTNRITLFDLVSFILPMVGWTLSPKNSNTFYVLNDRSNYSFTDSDKKSYEVVNRPTKGGISIEFSTLKLDGLWFIPTDRYYTDPVKNTTDTSIFVKYRYSGWNTEAKYYNIQYYNNCNPFLLEETEIFGSASNAAYMIFPYHANFGIAKNYYYAYEAQSTLYKVKTTNNLLNNPKVANKIAYNPNTTEFEVEYFVNV